MKITTRISLGYGSLLAIMLLLAVYQFYALRHMQSVNHTVAELDFQNSLTCLEAMRNLDLMQEYASKYFVLSDPEYLKLLGEYQSDFSGNLRDLKKRARAENETGAITRLAGQWRKFSEHLTENQPRLPTGSGVLPEILRQDFANLEVQLRSVYQAHLETMSARVAGARHTGENASFLLIASTLSAIIIGILVSFLIYRSISRPLEHLTAGTRAIAAGKFFYRLDTTRNDEFSQLARDFNVMTRRLDELDQLKKDFVAHVSHELKSPLASMRETIALLLDEIPGPLTDKQRRLLDLNRQSGARLTALIGNLLDLSRVEAGVMEYNLQSRDLVEVARGAVAEMEVQAGERGIVLCAGFPAMPLTVECDGDRITQVLINVLANAVKFSPEKSEIEIQLAPVDGLPENLPAAWRDSVGSAGHGGFAFITISDRGPGVAPEDRERIFEKFYQSRLGKKAPGQGAGLGLCICREICQAHRGAIWVEDNPAGGSRFAILLPAAA